MSMQTGVEPAAEVTNIFFDGREAKSSVESCLYLPWKRIGEGKGGIDPRILNRSQQRPEYFTPVVAPSIPID